MLGLILEHLILSNTLMLFGVSLSLWVVLFKQFNNITLATLSIDRRTGTPVSPTKYTNLPSILDTGYGIDRKQKIII